MQTATDNRNISRVDSGRTHGWLVRLQRDGEITSKLFSDRVHGGRGGSYQAALAWRDRQRERLGPTPRGDASHLLSPEARRRNRQVLTRTGVTGIGFQLRPYRGGRVPYVTAYWIDEEGRRRQTSFSVDKHGVEDAVALAARARAQTSEWHGGDPLSAEEIAERAEGPVRRLVREARRA
jgi:hypothetical protein